MTRDAAASSVLRNALASLVGRKLGQLLRAIATLQVAAYLGESGWGLFGFLISAFEVVRVLTSFGLDTAGLRAVALRERPPGEIVRTLLSIKSLTAAIGFLVVLVLALTRPEWEAHRTLLLLLALGLLPQAFTATLTIRFQAEHAMERLIPVQVASGAVYFLGVQVLIQAHSEVGGFIALNVMTDIFTCLLTWWMGRRRWAVAAEPPSGGGVWPLVLRGIPLGFVEVIVMIYSRLGVLLLTHYGGIVAVAHYYAAFKIAEPLVIIGGALAVSALPVLARLVMENQLPELRRFFRRYSLGSAALSGTLALVVSLLSAQVLRLLKPEYVAGAGALSALAWAAAFMLQNQLSSAVLNAFGKFHWIAACAAFNLCVYVALGLTLVPRLGPTGAGLATLGTEALNTVIQLSLVYWLLRGRNRVPAPAL